MAEKLMLRHIAEGKTKIPGGTPRTWSLYQFEDRDVHGERRTKEVAIHRCRNLAEFAAQGTPNEAEWTFIGETLQCTDHRKRHESTEDLWGYGSSSKGFPQGAAATLAAVASAKAPACMVAELKRVRAASKGAVARLSALARTLKRQRTYRIGDGSELDVDRAMSGEAAFWRDRTRGARRPSVTIGYGLTQSASQGWESFVRIASTVTACVEVLEAGGMAVRVLGIMSGTWDKGSSRVTDSEADTFGTPRATFQAEVIQLKGSEEPTVPGRLLAVGMPGVLRSFGFEHLTLRYGLKGGLGRPWVLDAYSEFGQAVRNTLGVTHFIGTAPNSEDEQVTTIDGIVSQALGSV